MNTYLHMLPLMVKKEEINTLYALYKEAAAVEQRRKIYLLISLLAHK